MLNGIVPNKSARRMLEKYNAEESEARTELASIKAHGDNPEELLDYGLMSLQTYVKHYGK